MGLMGPMGDFEAGRGTDERELDLNATSVLSHK